MIIESFKGLSNVRKYTAKRALLIENAFLATPSEFENYFKKNVMQLVGISDISDGLKNCDNIRFEYLTFNVEIRAGKLFIRFRSKKWQLVDIEVKNYRPLPPITFDI